MWSFQTGSTKVVRFLPKNQHSQMKSLNFEFWINGEPKIQQTKMLVTCQRFSFICFYLGWSGNIQQI